MKPSLLVRRFRGLVLLSAAPRRSWRAPRLRAWAFAPALLTLTVPAQHRLESWTVGGGGGTSTNAPYALTGTVGQTGAGPEMAGGGFTLTAGFWALPNLIQTPHSPVLSAAAGAPGFVSITWAPATPGWVLQESPSLEPASWTSVPGATNSPVTVPAALPARFYRLSRP